MQSVHRRLLSLFSVAAFGLAVAVAGPARAAITLDIDGNNAVDPTTDGILVLRYMFKIRGPALVENAIGAGATRNAAQIESYLGTLGSTLDIDGDGKVDALTDGVLFYRYVLGYRGPLLVIDAVGAGATRSSFDQIQNYIAGLVTAPVTAVAPSGCSITASPTSNPSNLLAPGTSVQLSANCTSGTQPISYTWDGGSVTGAVRTVNPSVQNAYYMSPSNAAGSGTRLRQSVFINSPQGLGYCRNTDDYYEIPWPSTGQVRVSTLAMSEQVSTFKITIPSTFNPPLNTSHVGFLHVAEVPGSQSVSREITISNTPCDFHTGPGGYLLDNLGSSDTGPGVNFTINNPNGYADVGAVINFQSGQTIYFSVRNFNYNNGNPLPTCPNTVSYCDIYLDFATPNRF